MTGRSSLRWVLVLPVLAIAWGCTKQKVGPSYAIEILRPDQGALAVRASETFADDTTGKVIGGAVASGQLVAIGDNDTARLSDRSRIAAESSSPGSVRLSGYPIVAGASDVRGRPALGGLDITVAGKRVVTVSGKALVAGNAAGTHIAASTPRGTEVVRLRDKQITPVVAFKTKADYLAFSEDGSLLLAAFENSSKWIIVHTDTGITDTVTTTPALVPVGVEKQGGNVLVLHRSVATAEIRETGGKLVYSTSLEPAFAKPPHASWSAGQHTVVFAEPGDNTTSQRQIIVWNYLDNATKRAILPEQELAYLFGTMLPADRAVKVQVKPRSFDRPQLND